MTIMAHMSDMYMDMIQNNKIVAIKNSRNSFKNLTVILKNGISFEITKNSISLPKENFINKTSFNNKVWVKNPVIELINELGYYADKENKKPFCAYCGKSINNHDKNCKLIKVINMLQTNEIIDPNILLDVILKIDETQHKWCSGVCAICGMVTHSKKCSIYKAINDLTLKIKLYNIVMNPSFTNEKIVKEITEII